METQIPLDLPVIPLEDLFQEQELPDPIGEMPLRWFSCNSTRDLLGISKRSIRRYAKRGLLERKYKQVGGNVRVYYTNRSVFKVKEMIEERKARNQSKHDIEDDEITLNELLKLGVVLALLDL